METHDYIFTLFSLRVDIMEEEKEPKMFVTENDYTPWLRLGMIRELEDWCIIKRDGRRGGKLEQKVNPFSIILANENYVVAPILLLRREFTKKPLHPGLTVGVQNHALDRNSVYN